MYLTPIPYAHLTSNELMKLANHVAEIRCLNADTGQKLKLMCTPKINIWEK